MADEPGSSGRSSSPGSLHAKWEEGKMTIAGTAPGRDCHPCCPRSQPLCQMPRLDNSTQPLVQLIRSSLWLTGKRTKEPCPSHRPKTGTLVVSPFAGTIRLCRDQAGGNYQPQPPRAEFGQAPFFPHSTRKRLRELRPTGNLGNTCAMESVAGDRRFPAGH